MSQESSYTKDWLLPVCRSNSTLPDDFDAVYADAGLIGGNGKATVGTWAFCYVKDNKIVYVESGIIKAGMYQMPTDRKMENDICETFALLRALSRVPTGWHGRVHSDNKNAIGRVFWEYKRDGIPESWFQYGLAKIDLAQSVAVHLDGHPTPEQLETGDGKRGNPVSIFNCFCDDECNNVRSRYEQWERYRDLLPAE